MWLWCIERKIWLSSTHLPGIRNVTADKKSIEFNDQTEWLLCSSVFKDLTHILGNPRIDLFASRLKTQCNLYVSWRPDQGSLYVDAFHLLV